MKKKLNKKGKADKVNYNFPKNTMIWITFIITFQKKKISFYVWVILNVLAFSVNFIHTQLTYFLCYSLKMENCTI